MKDKYRPWVPTVLTMYSVSWRIYNKWAVEPPHGDSYILTNLTDSLFSGEKNIIVEIFHKKTVTGTIKNSNFNFKVFIEHIPNIVCHARCHVRSHDRCLCLTRRRTLCTGRIWKFPLISSWVLIGSIAIPFSWLAVVITLVWFYDTRSKSALSLVWFQTTLLFTKFNHNLESSSSLSF